MGFKFYCIKCGLKMEIAENLLGMKFPCPKCGKKFVIDPEYMSLDDTTTQYYVTKIREAVPEAPAAEDVQIGEPQLKVAKPVPSKQ